jgi:hypothetical protein
LTRITSGLRLGEVRLVLVDLGLERGGVDLGDDLVLGDAGVEVDEQLLDRAGDLGADLDEQVGLDRPVAVTTTRRSPRSILPKRYLWGASSLRKPNHHGRSASDRGEQQDQDDFLHGLRLPPTDRSMAAIEISKS